MKNKLLVFGILLVGLLFISGCDVKLKNGKSAAVSFSEGAISSNDIYDILKEKYGEDEIVDIIDTYLLEKQYPNDESDKQNKDNSEAAYVSENVDQIKEIAEENDIDFETYIKQYYNVNNENELKEYLKLSYKRNKWIEDYTQESITTAELEKYYDEKVVGDMKLYHILISPDISENASDEEKEKADSKAKTEAQNIINELNDGADFKELAKKYSDDEATKNDGGSLGYINRDGYDEGFIEGAIPLKKGEYTKTPVKSTYGYHIIYKEKEKKKEKLEDIEDDIRTTIATEKLESDETLAYKALEALREKYDMKINDSALNKAYKRAIDNLYNPNYE